MSAFPTQEGEDLENDSPSLLGVVRAHDGVETVHVHIELGGESTVH
jgi:hypothetical protein